MTDNLRSTQDMPLLSEADLSLSLHRQRKRAKELRDAVCSGAPEALARLKKHHPHPDRPDPARFKLSDAQCIVAREAGVSSWPALKTHVTQLEQAKAAIESGETLPDDDLPTLHIRCGNDIERPLRRAGFSGDFLMIADPICQGPVSAGLGALETRARFLSSDYPGQDFGDSLTKLQASEDRLNRAHEFARVALWFEHDCYDQLLLCKVLTSLRASGADRRRVEIITLDKFPGHRKFIGIGQLSPAALHHMYAQRVAVPEEAYGIASRVWEALSAPSPEWLGAMALSENKTLPFLARALQRYLADLPGVGDGLSFTERAALGVLTEGPLPWAEIFRNFMRELDPFPFHGDLMFYADLLRLSGAGEPPLLAVPADTDREWGKQVFQLTDTGRQLLAGQKDFKSCRPLPRYQGGVTCFAAPDWRWDAQGQKPVAL
ncbi:DUF1835 domain-containing protein [Roseibium sp.]|uniref:DUF1835 domain-containing protein n=1 Tax=Roseibium sp. TaxID=1936156 RepID=UPI003A97119F